MVDYKKLQNGSDIRGVAMEGIDGQEVNLGSQEAYRLTKAFALWLSEKKEDDIERLCISVGHDSRLTADSLKASVIEALVHIGVKVYDCGLSSTPAMFMSTVFEDYACDGAIMITASHLPFNRNGFKYFDKNGGLNKEDISNIISYAKSSELLENVKEAETEETNPAEKRDLIGRYSEYLREKIIKEVARKDNPKLPLEGLKIVVDAGNGAGGFYANRILKELGADVSQSQFLEPDGTFPNHEPNPENKEAMESICNKVVSVKADLGLIFDTDVDRSSAVDSKGREINRNAIVAMAAALIAKEHPNTTVVTDSITSDQLTLYLEKCLGLKHLRFKRGYKNVINKSIELNNEGIDSQLAIETSGHAAYKENFFLDDGAYLATKIVIKAAQLKLVGKPIDVVLEGLEEPKEAIEKRYKIHGQEFAKYGEDLLEDLKRWASEKERSGEGVDLVEPNYEGVRINFKKDEVEGWCLLRKSLHDPILPLNIEVTKGSCSTIQETIEDFLKAYDKVEI